MKNSDPPVVVERKIVAPVATVWKAITDLEEMRDWFFEEIESFEPQVGFATKFTIEHDGKTYCHLWKLTEVEVDRRIVFDWQYEHCDGRGQVEWDLAATNDGTTLTLTNTVIESFPENDPAFSRESCEAGWEFLLDRLKDHIQTGTD